MEQSPSGRPDSRSGSQETHIFMLPEVSLSCSQETATGPCTEANESSPPPCYKIPRNRLFFRHKSQIFQVVSEF